MKCEDSKVLAGAASRAGARGSGAFCSALWWAAAARRPGGRSATAATSPPACGRSGPDLGCHGCAPGPRGAPARAPLLGPALRSRLLEAPPAAQFPGDRFPATAGGAVPATAAGSPRSPASGSSARAAAEPRRGHGSRPHRAEAGEWLARLLRSAAYQVGAAPSSGPCSRVFKTRGRRGLESKFAQRKSLEIAGPAWPDPGVGSEHGRQGPRGRHDGLTGSTPGPPGGAAAVAAHPGPEAAQGVCVVVCVVVEPGWNVGHVCACARPGPSGSQRSWQGLPGQMSTRGGCRQRRPCGGGGGSVLQSINSPRSDACFGNHHPQAWIWARRAAHPGYSGDEFVLRSLNVSEGGSPY